MKRRLFVLLVTTLAALAFLASPARGQDGAPPYPTNEYGTPDMDLIDLTLVEEYSECVYCIGVPGLGESGLKLSYDVYSDNYGNTWVVPDPVTVLYLAANPDRTPDGLANSSGYSYMSWNASAALVLTDLGDVLDVDVGGADVDTEQGVLDVLGDLGAMEWAHLGYMWALGGELWEGDSLPIWQMSWVYDDNPFHPGDDDDDGAGTPLAGTATPSGTGTPEATATPTPIPPTRTPRPTPTGQPTATPMPTPVECPPPSISQQPPSAVILDTSPPHPVVRGQGGQGLDVRAQYVSYPVVRRWWTREREYHCKWWDVETYGTPWGHRGHCCPSDNPDCHRDDYYMVPDEDWECVEHTQVIPDPILMDYCNGSALLRENSIEWIDDLGAGKYPGAGVKHPNWSVTCIGDPVILGDGRCVVEVGVHFPFEDPGWYDVEVHGQTAGTTYTPPRSFSYAMPTPQAVYLLDTMLEE